MKHYLLVLAAACVLLLALAASPAFAGGALPVDGSSQDQSVTNSTDQSNQAVAVNVPVASGNNVAVLSSGDQSNPRVSSSSSPMSIVVTTAPIAAKRRKSFDGPWPAGYSPPKVIKSKLNPASHIATKVANIVTGITKIATSVVPQLRRKP